MHDTRASTIPVPSFPAVNAALIVAATTAAPLIVKLLNSGGNTVIIAFDATPLQTSDSAGLQACFKLLAGQKETIVLAPGQRIFAVGSGAGGELSYIAFDYIPSVTVGAVGANR